MKPTLYNRLSLKETRAADTIHNLIAMHPEGVTFNELVRLHKQQIVFRDSAWAAVELLMSEGKLSSGQPWGAGEEDYLDRVKLFTV